MKIISTTTCGRLASAMLAALCLAACDDEEEAVQHEALVATSGTATTAAAWLGLGDGTPPELWLAGRAAGHPVAAEDPQVAILRRLLSDAAPRFNESTRMIANRTAQLEAMLAEKGISESPQSLLAGFLGASAAGAAPRDYGGLCQHYFNLRATGASRADALDALGFAGSPTPEKT